MKTIRLITFLIGVSSLFIISCGSSSDKSISDQDSLHQNIQKEAEISFDTGLTVTSRIIAGIDPGYKHRQADVASTKEWKLHKSGMTELFGHAEEKNLRAMRSWAFKEIPEGRDISATLFYAFSGPDFLYANTFYPGAKKYVLFGLEPVGKVPVFDTTKSNQIFFDATRRSLKSSLALNFFITKDMSGDLRTSEYNGVTSVIMLFSAYTGHKIKDMNYVYVQNDGKLKQCSYDSLRRVQWTKGVRFHLIDSLGMEKEVVYFSFNAENDPFNASSVKKYFENLDGKIFGMLKAASYLMHHDGFSKIREVFLSKITTLLTDDTGLAYKDIKKTFPKIQLYGTYSAPIESFNYIHLGELKQAYDSSDVKPIEFTYGYGYGQKLIIGRK